jgi:protein-tyrosine phosphatase
MTFNTRSIFAMVLAVAPMFAGPVPGIHNFDKVSENVLRGGQPTEDGFRYLAGIGVKTVIDLQEADDRSAWEQRTVTSAGMKYVNVPMTGLTPPSQAEITRILAILEDSTAGPVFVHCHRGADRTGAVIAAYHIDHDQWDNARALSDAKRHAMSPFQHPRMRFIKSFRPRPTDVKAVASVEAPAPAVSGEVVAAAPLSALTN